MQTQLITSALQCGEPGFFFSGCSRPEATLLACIQTSLHCVFQGKHRLLEPGAFLLLPPGSWYMLFADDSCAPELLTLTFSMGDAPFAPIHSQSPLLGLLARELKLQPLQFEQMCGLLLQQLLIDLRRQGAFSPAEPLKGDAAILCRSQKIICDCARQKLSVPLVAQKAGVSPSYLTALFHKHLPLAPGEYIRRVKLWESKAMIREGRLNFTQIAQALEYSTVHQFSRQFKEVFGITPTEYAKTAAL